MAEPKAPSAVDRFVGQRIRYRRRELKLTQEGLGELLGLTFQQVQKYEKGVNRIAAGRLYEVARILGAPVSFFFNGIEHQTDLPDRIAVAEEARGDIPAVSPVLSNQDLDLLSAFQAIEDEAMKSSILSMAQAAVPKPPAPLD